MERNTLFTFSTDKYILYVVKLLAKYLVMTLAVFAGMQLSQPNWNNFFVALEKLNDNPVKFLQDCQFICSKSDNNNVSAIISGSPEYIF